MNTKSCVFEGFAADYDHWFDDHEEVYHAQLLSKAVPSSGLGLEIGVRSGRFAAPLGICCGIDPSFALADREKSRGVEAVIGVDEHLPYRSGSFDHAVIMTVICFLDDLARVLQEVFRAENIRKGTDFDSREFWMAHFGDDPIWG